MTIGEWAARLRYRYVPDHVVGEVLGRRWMDNVIPVTLLVALAIFLATAIPNFTAVGNISDISRQIGEFGLIVVGLTIVMLAGGIDLSVGSNFALANVTDAGADQCREMADRGGDRGDDWRRRAGRPDQRLPHRLSQVAGVFDDARHADARFVRSSTSCCEVYSVRIATGDVESTLWDFVGAGSILGVPFSFVLLIVIAIVAHFVLTRLRIGWRIMAVGGSRRAAYNAGISVPRTVCLTYVVSGILSALAGTLYASRLSGAGPDTGIGLELTAVTAALIGGNSVGGGRGSVGKALMGDDHRLPARERAGPARAAERGVVDGRRRRPAHRDRHRCALDAGGDTVSAPRSMCPRAISRFRLLRSLCPTRLRPMR